MKGRRITEGRTAEIFAWGDGQVLKLYRTGWRREEAEREAVLARTVHAGGVWTPAVIDVVTVEDRHGLVFEQVEGPTMLAELQTRPYKTGAFARMLAELQAEMHAHTSLALPSQRQRQRRHVEAVAGMTDEVRAAVLAALERLPDGEAFCHGDFHPGNIILTPEGPVIIDWVDVTRGNPLADVARTTLLARVARPPALGLRLLLMVIQRWFRSAYLKRYRELRPFAAAELEAWQLPVAAVRLAEGLDAAENERLMRIVRSHVGSLGE